MTTLRIVERWARGGGRELGRDEHGKFWVFDRDGTHGPYPTPPDLSRQADREAEAGG